MKFTIPTNNLTLRNIHNFCILTGCELDVKKEKIILLEVIKDEKISVNQYRA